MKNWLIKLMRGRYGVDKLSNVIFTLSVILILLSILLKNSVLNTLGIVALLIGYFRMFSRNINARYRENMKFMEFYNKLTGKVAFFKKKTVERGQYKYFKCPSCGQQLRVPRGKGRVNITCPKCKTSFIRKA
ncbi:MAG: hypothetical protein RBT15_05210 [Gudongella sp.]|nr:hypothetical protein [Gudongella sp.]